MTVFTHDSAVRAFDGASGAVTQDDEGDISFDWDERHVVTVDAPADLEGAFDTNEFYKIEDATIARPIKQLYVVDDELKTYKKPAEELRNAAWSFDNAPFTLDHPTTGMVKNVNDIHGFWRGARYDEDEERLVEDLYVPTEDDEALEWLEDNSDVSLGFFNRVHEEYDGDTGDLADEEGVDGYQVDILGNHVAGVEQGRCSGEDGCGLDHDNDSHGTVTTVSEASMTTADENANDDETSNCNTCSDMGDDDNDTTTDGGDFEIPDLSVDALAEKNDAVRTIVDERDELQESVDEAESTMEEAFDSADHFSVSLDDDECYCEAVADLVADLDEKAEEAKDLREDLSEYREEEKEEALDDLEDLGADREDWDEEDLDEIEEEIDRREEIAEDLNVSVKNVTDSGGDTEEETDGDENHNGTVSYDRGYGA